ncbi:Acid phosphatase [Grifola frondosa]|uniref:laccase n=1 Tax=Grifola frondosa TaxID=5627 RepID=A0A1C7MH11_GRIFR|nr:Acid phosphatase [Grifola frondosa]
MSTDLVNEPTTTRTYNWVVEEGLGAPDGVVKNMLVVNGIYPGPTIEANEGDRIIVNVTNKIANATTIHWHGLYQRGTNYYDGTEAITQCGIPPGQSMVYNYTVENWVGSTWWHAHSGTQYTDGITGALIVHGKNESVPPYDEDLVIQMSDLYHDFSPALLNLYFTPGGIDGTPGNEPVPDGGTINGVGQYGSTNTSFFNATLQPNKTYRLRLINSGSFVAIQFSVDSHILTVIEADGTAVNPFDVASVSIALAQRYSVLLHTNNTVGAYWIRAALDTTAYTYDNPGATTEIYGVLRYGVDDSVLPDVSLLDNPPSLPSGSPGELDTADLAPAAAGPAPDPTFHLYFEFSMQYPGVANYLSHFLGFINSTSWEPLNGTSSLFSHIANATTDGSANFDGSQLITTLNEVQVMQVAIDNLDDGDHPFHLHGHKFWVMGSGAGRYQNQTLQNTNPMMRDTLVLPAYTWTVLRFVADNPGFWAFHCHIQWHMAAEARIPVPQQPLAQTAVISMQVLLIATTLACATSTFAAIAQSFAPPAVSPESTSSNYTGKSNSTISNGPLVAGKSFDRFIQIWLENTDFETAASSAVFQNLSKQGVLMDSFYAMTHPSEPNYIAVAGGDFFGNAGDNFRHIPSNISSIVDLLEAKNVSWSSYQENAPYDGFTDFNYTQANYLTGTGQYTYYVRKHNPLIIFDSVTNVSERALRIRNFNDFAVDLNASAIPQWSFITPNLVNDGHDTTIDFIGQWLQFWLIPLLADERFNDNRTIILLTFDETETYTINNRVYTLVLGGGLPTNLRGTTDSTFYTHYSALSTVQANWALGSLGRGDTNATLNNVFSWVANATSWTNNGISGNSSAIPLLNLTGTIPGPFNPDLYTLFYAPNTSAVGAGGGPVFIGPGLNTSLTFAALPPPVNLTAEGQADVPWAVNPGISYANGTKTIIAPTATATGPSTPSKTNAAGQTTIPGFTIFGGLLGLVMLL